MYLVRFIICFMTVEYILPFMYVVAIKDSWAWVGDSPAEIGMIGFWNLIVVWLKVRNAVFFFKKKNWVSNLKQVFIKIKKSNHPNLRWKTPNPNPKFFNSPKKPKAKELFPLNKTNN